MRNLLGALASVVLVVGLAGAADEAPAKKSRPSESASPGLKQTYLGVGVEAVSPALSNQMPGVVPKGQGVLVTMVDKDSPAAKAGVQPYDILLSVNDQKVYSPEQLVKLVRGEKSGQEISLGIVRGGKAVTSKVKVGERDTPIAHDRPRAFHLRPDQQVWDTFEEAQSKGDHAMWDSFDAIRLTRVSGDKWKAEIDYRSKEGKAEHKAFEGTREALRKDIQAEKDLPANERGHLLRALNLQVPVLEFRLPPFGGLDLNDREQP